jgi:membrane fusion protein (multidrug efflux system)
MPDTILKLVPSVERRRTRATRLMGFLRRRKRILLMLVVSLVAAVAGGLFYMSGGRYVSIDDDYVHAAKLMVSTDVSGIVDSVNVREGQSVKTGDVLFRLDPRPFQIALATLRAGA